MTPEDHYVVANNSLPTIIYEFWTDNSFKYSLMRNKKEENLVFVRDKFGIIAGIYSMADSKWIFFYNQSVVEMKYYIKTIDLKAFT